MQSDFFGDSVECTVPMSATAERLCEALQCELRALKPRRLHADGNRLEIVGGLLRPVLGLNLLVPASRVAVTFEVDRGRARLHYVASFTEIIVACLAMGAVVSVAVAKAGGPWAAGIGLGVAMAAANVLQFRFRFRRLLVRTAASTL